MSFVVTVGRRSPGEEQAGELLIRESRGLSVVDSPRDLVLLKGEVFDHTPQQTADLLCTNGVTALPRLSGEFSVVRYSKDDGLVWFATDRLWREPLFFCIDGGCLIVSDDFWEVVNVINPSGSSIDVQAVKEFLLFRYPLFDGTIVRGVRFLQPSTVGEFSCAGQMLRQWRYWDLRYCPDMSVSEDTAVERLDASLHAAFAQIAGWNPGRSYGIGVSGGLDSRVIPYYALKHSMPLKSFIIGQRTPHRFWLSRDHRSARDVASYYGLTHSEVEWDSDTFDDKMLRDARFYAMGAPSSSLPYRARSQTSMCCSRGHAA
jgi:asparagine synthetase B (glutamine-hydrolysing)